jgi:predicted transcriptional regulator
MAKKEQKVGRAELEILHFVQDHRPVSVRDVADHFAETRGHVRTTILNVMERLRKKGFLTRKKAGGIYQYEPRVGRAELLRSLVGDFVEKTLGGSLSPFVAYLSRDARLSEKELNELKQAVSGLRGKEKSEPLD